MRVGIVARTIPPFDRGGIQTHVLEFAQALAALGDEVHLYVSAPGARVPGVVLHDVPALPVPGLTLGEYLSRSIIAGGLAARDRPDLVHGHALYGVGSAMRRGTPFVLTLHGTQLNEFRSSCAAGRSANHVLTDGAGALLERYSARRAARVIAVSEENRRDALAQYGLDPSRVAVIPNGVRPDRFRLADHATRTVLYVGRLHEKKQVHHLIDAFAKVAAEVPDARLRIVGRGEEEARLRSLVRRKKLDGRVEFAGFVPDAQLPAAFAEATCFVLPSRAEGFAVTLLEAMAAGLPVVATRTGGAPMLVEDGVDGYLVDRGTLAGRMIELLRDPARARSMGQRGRAKVEHDYTWSAIARRVRRVYEDALAGRSGSV